MSAPDKLPAAPEEDLPEIEPEAAEDSPVAEVAEPGQEPVDAAAEPERAAEPEPRQEPEKKARGLGWLVVLLLLALAAASFGYLYEEQRANRLETQVTALEAELVSTRSELQAQEQRMTVIRGHVDDLAARFRLLQQAVAPRE